MKATFALLLLTSRHAIAAVIEQRAACNQDNCYRAVIKPSSLPARSSDCSSFLAGTATVTIAAATITTTTYSIYGGAATTPTVPTYATACSGSVRYSSACSCLGITQAATTTVTLAPSATATVTSTIIACDPNDDYGLNYNGVSYNPPPGAQLNSSYGPDNFFTSTPAECCAACFSTLGCGEFIFGGNNYCTLFAWDGVTVTDPYDPVCPWGKGSFSGESAYSIAPGPCAYVVPYNP